MNLNDELEWALGQRNAAMKWCEDLENARLRFSDLGSGFLYFPESEYWPKRHEAHMIFIAARDAHHEVLARIGIESVKP